MLVDKDVRRDQQRFPLTVNFDSRPVIRTNKDDVMVKEIRKPKITGVSTTIIIVSNRMKCLLIFTILFYGDSRKTFKK